MSDSITSPILQDATEERPTPSLTVQAFWLMVAKALGFVLTVVLPILLVRVFSPRDFGLYKQAFVVVGTALAILPFNVGMSAFYFLPRRPEKRSSVVLNIVAYYASVGLVAGAVIALWPGCLELILGRGTPLTGYSSLIGAIIFASVLASFLEMVATAAADVLYSTVFIIGAQASRAVLLTCAAVFGRTVEMVFFAAVAHGTLQCIVLLWYLDKRYPRFWRQFDPSLAKEQFWYVLPLGLTGVIYSIQNDLHNYLVANMFTAAQYALYAVGTTPVPFVGILRESVNSVMLPRVSKLHQQGNREEILLLMLRSWHKLAAAIIPLTGVLYAVGYEFITVFYTQRYQASWPIFALNLAVLLLGMMITDAVVRGHPEIRSWMFITRFVGIVVQIGVSLLTIPVFGMIGALLGIVVAGVVDRIIMLTVLFRLLGFGPRHLRALSGIAGFALGSVVAAAAAITVKWLVHGYPPMVRLVCGAATFGVIYVITVLKMDVLNADEKAVLNRYLRKLPGCRSLQVS